MFKKIVITLIGVVIVVGGIVYAKLGQFQAMGEAAAKMTPPPETVTAATAEVSQWERSIPVSGTLAAARGVTVSAEVAGRIERIRFESGAIAKAGDILVQLDTSSEDAQLASAQAASQLARATLARRLELAKRNLVSAADVDTARAQAKEAAAQIGVVRATIDKKTVRAPFDGRLGLRLVDLGQIVSAGVPIVSLQTLDPVHVNFSVPQQQLPSLATGLVVRVTADAAPGEAFEGRINALSPEVDPVTRNVRVQAEVANPRGNLFAGMFANVEVVLPNKKEVLAIPATAVLYAPFGNSVFVIEAGGDDKNGAQQVLRQQFVRLGEARGDFVNVLDGLKAGEKVASSGVFKLRSEMPVVIDNRLAPNPQLNPKPANS